MRYSIRYEQRGKPRTAEVEANSPHEAMVKFRSIQVPQGRSTGPSAPRVTSVSQCDGFHGMA